MFYFNNFKYSMPGIYTVHFFVFIFSCLYVYSFLAVELLTVEHVIRMATTS